MSSSRITRSNAPAICEGIGTMKRLTTPTRIRISIDQRCDATKRAEPERERHEAHAL